MVLIIGGAYQGKTAFAKAQFGLKETEIFTCSGTELDTGARCICHLERFSFACVQAGKEPAEQLAQMDLTGKVLICDDISCGVVPIDPVEREWREATGRMNGWLASRASRVVRLFCGLPLELKK